MSEEYYAKDIRHDAYSYKKQKVMAIKQESDMDWETASGSGGSDLFSGGRNQRFKDFVTQVTLKDIEFAAKDAKIADPTIRQQVRSARIISMLSGSLKTQIMAAVSNDNALLNDSAALMEKIKELVKVAPEVELIRNIKDLIQVVGAGKCNKATYAEINRLCENVDFKERGMQILVLLTMGSRMQTHIFTYHAQMVTSGSIENMVDEVVRFDMVGGGVGGLNQGSSNKKSGGGKARNSNGGGGGGGRKPFRGTCYACGKTGHKSTECSENKDKPPRKVAGLLMGPGAQDTGDYEAISLRGTLLTARLDSGSDFNLIRRDVATNLEKAGLKICRDTEWRGAYNIDMTPSKVNGEYIECDVKSRHTRFYVAEALPFEAILGHGWTTRQHDPRIFCIELIEPLPPNSPYRFVRTPEEKALIKQFLKENQDKGWIAPSDAKFGANLMFVDRPDKTDEKRAVVDFTHLNKYTKPWKEYELPNLKISIEKVRGFPFLSKVDISKAFHHMRVQNGQAELLSFEALGNMYKYLVMPMGVTNGPAYWQAYVDSILQPFGERVLAFADDIILMSESRLEHELLIKQVLQVLEREGLVINEKKSVLWPEDSIKFVGHQITPHGEVRLDHTIPFLERREKPKTLKQLQQWTGIVNQYVGFIEGIGTDLAPLYAIQSKEKWVRSRKWSDEANAAFEITKKKLLAYHNPGPDGFTFTVMFSPDADLVIYIDASLVGIGVKVMQEHGILGWDSRKFSAIESARSTTDRELSALMHAFFRFLWMVRASKRRVIFKTDHSALTKDGFNKEKSGKQVTMRRQRWALELSPYVGKISIEYIKGEQNPADYPSRDPIFTRKRKSYAEVARTSDSEAEAEEEEEEEEEKVPAVKQGSTESEGHASADNVSFGELMDVLRGGHSADDKVSSKL